MFRRFFKRDTQSKDQIAAKEQKRLNQRSVYESLPRLVQGNQKKGELFTNGDIGALHGFALEVKPAVFLGALEYTGQIKRFLEARDIEVIVVDQYVVNKKLVERRVQADPEFAQKVGWDESASVEENIKRLNEADNEESIGLRGFVLGYPKSAIEGFERETALKKRGVPSVNDLYNTSIPRVAEELGIADWKEEDRVLLKKFSADLARVHDQLNLASQLESTALHTKLTNETHKRNKTELKHLYQTYFDATEEEIDFLLSINHIHIPDVDGCSIYSFMIFGQEDEEVKQLKEAVATAIQEMTL